MSEGASQLSNADIANRLMGLAQLLSTQKENPFKVKAYRRAAKSISTFGDSLDELVRSGSDLTELPGIGKAIAGVIGDIVVKGTSRQLEALKERVSPEVAALVEYPKLDPKRVLRIYKKLSIDTTEALRASLASGEIALKLGVRMEQHVRQAMAPSSEMLLYDADKIVAGVESFLLATPSVKRVEATGAYRRRAETVHEISFLVETDDFEGLVTRTQRFGGGTKLVESAKNQACFELSSGVSLEIRNAAEKNWGSALVTSTGSAAHLEKLAHGPGIAPVAVKDEPSFYAALGLAYIEPELREGRDEVDLAATGGLPELVTARDIRGELHAHSTSSDGVHTIEQMARAALAKGYEYTGISDHSKSLKIAGGLSDEDLWKQIRYIDKLNAKCPIRILKSSEVDILEDGALDYPDELLRELDYTVCSIHSRFALGKEQQTERILRAMDSRYFTILGHATGRLLLKRRGYEIDVERVVMHAQQRGCYFEINSSPDRLDLSAVNARLASSAGVKLAINTDAHSSRDYDLVRCGIDQARRAGLTREGVLNALPLAELEKTFRGCRG